MSTAINTIGVPFDQATDFGLRLRGFIDPDGTTWYAAKTLSDQIGLSWKPQQKKLTRIIKNHGLPIRVTLDDKNRMTTHGTAETLDYWLNGLNVRNGRMTQGTRTRITALRDYFKIHRQPAPPETPVETPVPVGTGVSTGVSVELVRVQTAEMVRDVTASVTGQLQAMFQAAFAAATTEFKAWCVQVVRAELGTLQAEVTTHGQQLQNVAGAAADIQRTVVADRHASVRRDNELAETMTRLLYEFDAVRAQQAAQAQQTAAHPVATPPADKRRWVSIGAGLTANKVFLSNEQKKELGKYAARAWRDEMKQEPVQATEYNQTYNLYPPTWINTWVAAHPEIIAQVREKVRA